MSSSPRKLYQTAPGSFMARLAPAGSETKTSLVQLVGEGAGGGGAYGAGRALTSAAFAAIDVTSNAESAAVVCNSLRMMIPSRSHYSGSSL
jgi:hypothetical protein